MMVGKDRVKEIRKKFTGSSVVIDMVLSSGQM